MGVVTGNREAELLREVYAAADRLATEQKQAQVLEAQLRHELQQTKDALALALQSDGAQVTAKGVKDKLIDGLNNHPVWKGAAFTAHRATFITQLNEQFFYGKCRACLGVGHDVHNKCGLNNKLDKYFKNMGGVYNGMWSACKHIHTRPGAKAQAFAAQTT